MGKRTFSILLALALVASVFGALPAGAQTVTIPETPNIVDPANDGNFLNDQGNRDLTGFQGDNVTPADASTVADMLKVWFSHDSDSVYIHYLTQAAPPATTSIVYQTYTSPGTGSVGSNTVGCLRWVALIPGQSNGQNTTYHGKPVIKLVDRCNDGTNVFSNGVAGEYTAETVAGQGGVLTVKFPRSYSPLLADGQKLTTPFAETRLAFGGETPAATTFNSTATVDNTKVGTDYTIAAGGPVVAPAPEPKEEPPGKSDPPGKGKKKGCKKGKGKKKGACPSEPKPPTASSCPTYTPGDMGKDAPLTVVTDEAAEDKPIEIDVPLGLATGNIGSDRTTRAKHNVQIDSTVAEAGFYARLEAPGGDDPDLYVYYASGKQAAVAGGFNPLLVGGPLPNPANNATIRTLNGQGTGGHSEFTAEQVDGLRSPDCRGWTLDLVNWAGRGGTYKLKLWLGEIQNDPAPEQEAESESALDTFFGLLLTR